MTSAAQMGERVARGINGPCLKLKNRSHFNWVSKNVLSETIKYMFGSDDQIGICQAISYALRIGYLKTLL